MKEIYLAMDISGLIFGYDKLPKLNNRIKEWEPQSAKWYNINELKSIFGIDVTKFPLTHEQPIKIRAKWEQINE